MPTSVAPVWNVLLNRGDGGRVWAASIPPTGSWGSWSPPVPLALDGCRRGRPVAQLLDLKPQVTLKIGYLQHTRDTRPALSFYL